jgi:Ni/Co efflux regulator RcnB
MKNYLVMLGASLLLAATAATATPPQRQGQHGQWSQNQHGQRDGHRDRDRRHGHERYVRDRHGWHDDRGRYYVMHDRGRHEGWYKRGGYLPVRYRADRYYVTDWRTYRLRPPPRGYHWIRSDNSDFLLVAIATGIITDIVLSN